MPAPIIPEIDEDACLRARLLRQARTRIISGGQEAEYEYRANDGVGRRLKYTFSDLSRLEAAIEEAERVCAGTGRRRRRFAIQGVWR